MLKILFQWTCMKSRIVFYNITAENNSTFALLLFWFKSAFFEWQMSIDDAKWTVTPDVLASSITCFLHLTLVKFHAEIFSNFSHSLSTAAFAAGIFIAWGIRMNLWTKLLCCNEFSPFPCKMVFVIMWCRVSHTYSSGFIRFFGAEQEQLDVSSFLRSSFL